ncbi:family 10 glycosylhydrolase [candidate division KSB1 bacterium]|nr:family 10 glycosylhydrolase [candidate division KSB1 bacterium]
MPRIRWIRWMFLFFSFTGVYAQRAEFRAVKITNVDSRVLFSDAKIAEAMDFLASIGINVVLPVVWNGSGADGVHTLYPSAVMESRFGRRMHPQIAAYRDPLQRLIIEAHRNGMEVMPWFEMGFSSSYSQNGGYILQRYPEWACRTADGQLVVKNGFDWMSAIHPDVQDLIRSLVVEVVENYDIDGIEFSDRIPAMPVEGGYEASTVALYRADHGGSNPPAQYWDRDWMRWRADRLSDFLQHVRDTIRAKSEHVVLSSSPNVYPWGFEEYLQDSHTWIESGIIDNLISQVYRYSFADYFYELDRSLGFVSPSLRHLVYSGMLIQVGSYTISPAFFRQCLQANRDRGLLGEAFFFYEGLRKNDDQLGLLLRDEFYYQDALPPHRDGWIWRPRPFIVNEDDEHACVSGKWDFSELPGYRGGVLLNRDLGPASLSYRFHLPYGALYDVYAYVLTGPKAAPQAHYTVYSATDSLSVQIDQTRAANTGWQRLATVELNRGEQVILRLDNRHSTAGVILAADAVMVMLNRKLSPDVVVTDVKGGGRSEFRAVPETFVLKPNHPNPFRQQTQISFTLQQDQAVELAVFDVLGRQIEILFKGNRPAGEHRLIFTPRDLPAGIYFYRLHTQDGSVWRKMVWLGSRSRG